MKLIKRISWLMGTLQRTLFPKLEECWETALTDKEQVARNPKKNRFFHWGKDVS